MNRRDIDTYYRDTKQELDEKLSQASELLAAIQQKLDEVEAGRQQGSSALNNLNESYQQITNLINQTHTDLARVTELRTAALDTETGLEAMLQKVNETHEKAESLFAQINSFSTEVEKRKNDTGADAVTSKRTLEKITKIKDDAQTLLDNIEKTYQIAINTGLAGSFDRRQKEIQDQFVKPWARRFAISLTAIGLIASGVILVSFRQGFTFETLTLFRLSLLTPLIFYTGYAAVQYNTERRLLEKYAFKATIAVSLEGYMQVLKQNFTKKEHDEKIINFVLDSMAGIYGEPHEEVKRRSYGVRMDTKLAKVKSEIVEEVGKKVEQTALSQGAVVD